MEQYVGLDVSQSVTNVCVVDREGKPLWEGDCDSTPDAIANVIRRHAPQAVKIGFESRQLSTWHWHGLTDLGLPAICIDAYHAHGALKLQMNKTDKNDARGIAQIMRCGWYRQVQACPPSARSGGGRRCIGRAASDRRCSDRRRRTSGTRSRSASARWSIDNKLST